MIRQGSKRVSRVACIKKDLVTMISIEGKGKHLLNDLLAFIMPSWKSSNEFPTLNLLLAFFSVKTNGRKLPQFLKLAVVYCHIHS